jgi:hypothetical protein
MIDNDQPHEARQAADLFAGFNLLFLRCLRIAAISSTLCVSASSRSSMVRFFPFSSLI